MFRSGLIKIDERVIIETMRIAQTDTLHLYDDMQENVNVNKKRKSDGLAQKKKKCISMDNIFGMSK
jgi:hypothetical protein